MSLSEHRADIDLTLVYLVEPYAGLELARSVIGAKCFGKSINGISYLIGGEDERALALEYD